jgi:hypothetical protein
MIELVGFEPSQFIPELLQEETVSSGPVLIRENKRMTKMKSMRR